MSTSLFEDIANAPDDPPAADPLFAMPEVETDDDVPRPRRTRQPRKPRAPKIDPETGEEIKRTYVRSDTKLNDELLEGWISAASDLSAVSPTAAGVMIARAEATVDGLMALAKGKKRTTAVLRKVASVSKISELLTTALMLVIGFGVDFGKIPAESPILDRIGYAEVVRENGKLKRDEQGFVVKDHKTLREIYDKMHPHQTVEQQPVMDMPQWVAPSTGTGHARFAPGNWVPK